VIGSTISHYRILEQLGGGGMGVVYRAHDERLDRDVALKVLPAGMLADETARSRFRREALTLSQLNRPNIAVIHHFDSDKGVDFLTMEFVAGETLSAKAAAGPLPEKEVVGLGVQIAEALEEAHEHNIIHRDLKPANVMVTAKGRAKVLDFGLAKLTRPSEADGETASLAETQAGAVMGTVPYMAPEQLQGKTVDMRADIYPLGAVLYEMTTGRRPFPEKQTSQLIAAILTRTPAAPRELNGQVSPGLEAIILKALAKNPNERYQSAKEALEDLARLSIPGSAVGLPRQAGRKRWVPAVVGAAGVLAALAIFLALNVGGLRSRLWPGVGAGSATPEPKIQSLAVLPLENLSGDPKQDYFADGMTEELITNLAQISALKVISRSSMMRYKGTRKTVPQIAKELNVDAVIEGSVLREGSVVRITVQLIDARTQRDIWAQSYQRDLRSVMALQGVIAASVAGKVSVTLTPAERSRLASARTVNPQAYETYLKGKSFLNKMTPEGFEKGLVYMQRAIKMDPTNPMPYAGVAIAYARIGHSGASEAFPKAKAAALTAEKLGGPSAEMYLALGAAELESDWDFPAAEKDLQRAVELNPSLGEAHRTYSWCLAMKREPDRAIEEMRRARQVEPLTPAFAADLAWQYWTEGEIDRAIEQAQESLDLQPNFNEGLAVLGSAYTEKGMYAQAIATHRRLAATGPRWKWFLPYTYARAGEKDAARETLAKFLEEKPKPTGAWAGWFVAADYTALGNKDEAFHWLQIAFKAHHSFFPWLRSDPLLVPLHSDPRFQALVRRMNFPQDRHGRT
jgi:TolB-like protein/Tfp pilus assembly protein PilF